MRISRTQGKADLATIVAEKMDINKASALMAIDTIISAIVDADKTTLKGFGVFEWRKRKARTARNPITGETIHVPETETLHFKPSTSLKNL